MFRRLIPKCSVQYKDIQEPRGSEDAIHEEVRSIKTRINLQKSRLDNINISLIKSVMKSIDKYYSLHKILKRRYNAQVVTNAWLKCYEIVTEFNILDLESHRDHRNILFNAELPGGFICAINHYIKTKTTLTFDWLANSLYDSSGPGDRYGIFQENPSNWVMGEHLGHNGDVTNIEVIEKIEDHVLSTFPNGVDLYTSDIGVDVSNDYEHQEELNSLENLGQIILGLKVLSKGGNMLIKIYTYFTDYTLSLLVILNTLFDFMYITKPLTSKPTNSELYVICKGYNGISFELTTLLCNHLIKHKNEGTLPYKDGSLVNLQHPKLAEIKKVLLDTEIKIFGDQQYKTLEYALCRIQEENGKWKRVKNKLVSINNAYEHNRWFFFNSIIPLSSKYHIKTKIKS